MPFYAHRFESPVGELISVVDARGGLRRLEFAGPRAADVAEGTPGLEWDRARNNVVMHQLSAYFRRKRQKFELKLAPEGTEFQLRIWAELMKIPFGKTITYLQLAERFGDPLAARAVAQAVAHNPIAIVVPCHRVIGSDGSLTGYGGGLPAKQYLLELEGAIRQPTLYGALTSAGSRRRSRRGPSA